MTERKPDASLEPSFAESAQRLQQRLLNTPGMSLADCAVISDLIACIREQRAALEAVSKLLANRKCSPEDVLIVALLVEDTTNKWRIE